MRRDVAQDVPVLSHRHRPCCKIFNAEVWTPCSCHAIWRRFLWKHPSGVRAPFPVRVPLHIGEDMSRVTTMCHWQQGHGLMYVCGCHSTIMCGVAVHPLYGTACYMTRVSSYLDIFWIGILFVSEFPTGY